MKGNNFVMAGHIWKRSENPDNSGNDRSMKGINFVTAGQIRKKTKSAQEREVEQCCHGRTGPEKEKVGKIWQNPEMRGT